MAGQISRLAEKVLRHIKIVRDGATCEEVEQALGMKHQTC